MFDKKGNVIGIVVAGVPGAENVGYAIKTSYLKILLESVGMKMYGSAEVIKERTAKRITRNTDFPPVYIDIVQRALRLVVTRVLRNHFLQITPPHTGYKT